MGWLLGLQLGSLLRDHWEVAVPGTADLEVPAQAGLLLKGPVPVWVHGAPWGLYGRLWRNIWMERSSGQWYMDVELGVESWPGQESCRAGRVGWPTEKGQREESRGLGIEL